jgi:hypothetical protein
MLHFQQKVVTFLLPVLIAGFASAASPPDRWELAQERADIHRFSTLFTARQVTEDLATNELIDEAIDWCKGMGITKVYLETFRSRHQVVPTTIAHARDRFRQAGFVVSGCVTTTQIGKISTGWNLISCYTSATTQQQTREIFEFTAKLFDEIMIDDFWFTDCSCEECREAREARKVSVDGRVWPVDGGEWADYRCELMARVSRQLVLEPARRINPDVKVIIKYPQWYDNFQERGYDVIRQTADFDIIWVGTEIRDEHNERWGGRGRSTAYFLQSWLEEIGGDKCGGGWYDTLGTTPTTYLSQARQTILGGARESMLFNAGNLRSRDTGPDDAAALLAALPELLDLAANVRRRSLVGMAMYKPPGSSGDNERRVFEHVGMLGIPFVTCSRFPVDAPAAFFSIHALDDPTFPGKLDAYLQRGRPTLITDGLAKRLNGRVNLDRDNVHVLAVNGDPKTAWSLPADRVDAIRTAMLRPFAVRYQGPARTALYLFDDGSWVVESFQDAPINVTINGKSVGVEANGWTHSWK